MQKLLNKKINPEIKKNLEQLEPKPHLKDFLDIVHGTCKFITEQKINEKPLTRQQIEILLDVVEVLLKAR